MANVLTPDPGREFTLEFLLAQLRALRLFRLAEEMPTLLEEAAKDGWGQLGLLSEIFRREGLRLSQRRFERNMKASGLNESYGIIHGHSKPRLTVSQTHPLIPSFHLIQTGEISP